MSETAMPDPQPDPWVDSTVSLLAARNAMMAKDYDAADAHLEAALRADPDNKPEVDKLAAEILQSRQDSAVTFSAGYSEEEPGGGGFLVP